MTQKKPEIVQKMVLSEYEFYEVYFRLLNARKTKHTALTDQEILVASTLCAKPLSFTLDKEKGQNGKSKKIELAEELGINQRQIYAVIRSLEEKGILQVSEDHLIDTVPNIRNLRRVIKAQVPNFNFNYVIDFTINWGSDNGSSETSVPDNRKTASLSEA